MEKILVTSSTRQEKGKSACKKLRKSGVVPGVVYKSGKENLALSVNGKELWSAIHTEAGENAIITLDITDGKKKLEKTVIVQETQSDPINDKLLHVDFHEISLTEKIQVGVPVSVKGEAEGVVSQGGVLNQLMWEIKVECFPMDIPDHIEIEVTKLKIGDAIYIKDVVAPAKTKILGDPDQLVASVNPPHMEEAAAPEAVTAEEAAEPEVIKKGKKEEEEEAAEGEAPAAEAK